MIEDDALAALSSEFQAIYSDIGHSLIPSEKLLRTLLLKVFTGIRSERQILILGL